MSRDDAWLADKLSYLRALKKPSSEQTLILALAEKSPRTPAEDKTLAALIRVERASERMQAARSAATRLLRAREISERKARNYRMIQQGLLVDHAGLGDWDRATLMGALLELSRADEGRKATWRQAGAAWMAQAAPDKGHQAS